MPLEGERVGSRCWGNTGLAGHLEAGEVGERAAPPGVEWTEHGRRTG